MRSKIIAVPAVIIKNAKLVFPQGLREWEVRFDENAGVISEAGGRVSSHGEEVFDASGLFLLPGLVDAHVHLRDPPGSTRKEDFLTGTTAALAGGVTTVMDMPNTLPPTTSAEALEEKKKVAGLKAACDYAFHFGATAENADEARRVEAGVAGKKIFLSATSFATALAEEALEKHFRNTQKPVLVHAEDEKMIEELRARYERELGVTATAEIHNKVRLPEAAASAVEKAVALAEETQAHLHVCHVSTAKEMEVIKNARSRGVNVTCEVTPHHLFLAEDATKRLGNFVKVNPPLRAQEDVDALWKEVNAGAVTSIASDHAPHLREEKQGDYWSAPSGVPGLETMLPLLLDAASRNRVSLEKIVELACYNPALKFGLKYKGRLEKGCDADFVLVDLREETVVEEERLYTKCGWSPFAGMRLKGKIKSVFLRGKLVYDGEHLVARPGGGNSLF